MKTDKLGSFLKPDDVKTLAQLTERDRYVWFVCHWTALPKLHPMKPVNSTHILLTLVSATRNY